MTIQKNCDTISKLISQLQTIQEKYGDVTVKLSTQDGECYSAYDFEIEQCADGEDILFIS